jgi:uncharacterized damage-inducible protein DinB
MYIDLLPNDGRVLEHLATSVAQTAHRLRSVPPDALLYRYAEGKWTVKEVLVHIVDDERIYAYRALRFARNDDTELPGFEQDAFVRYSEANARNLESILAEYAAVRDATIALFASLSDEALTRSGVADGSRTSVRALAYHMAGHEAHHLNILRDRYRV